MAKSPEAAEKAVRSAAQLLVPAEDRGVVAQALGLVMEHRSADDDIALALLRHYSRTSNAKLVEVARALVKTRSTSAASPAPPRRPTRQEQRHARHQPQRPTRPRRR